jgi:hypothetical protein
MNNYKLTKKENIIVHSFSCLFDEMYSRLREKLENMSINDLKDTIDAFSKTSTTNCSWTSWEMKDIVLRDSKWILKEKEKLTNS